MNQAHSLAVVILAAGKGTRMKSDLPKVLHPVGGQPMLRHVMDHAAKLNPEHMVVVTAPHMEAIRQQVEGWHPDVVCVEQAEQLGTGDAVKAAESALSGFKGDVLVLYGDSPLITTETMQALLEKLHDHDVAVLGMRPEDPGAYGRLILGDDGTLEAIVEYKDATDTQRAVTLCNSGVMAVRGGQMFSLLSKVGNDNASGEYYLTDIVGIARSLSLVCAVAEADEEELLGVNSRSELAVAEAIFQQRMRTHWMREGVTLIDPETVYFSADTQLASDVVIQPNVFFGPGVRVDRGTEIRAFSHFEGVHIGADCLVGPFARLRPGSVLEGGNKVGNFVELKQATMKQGAAASHLSYLGDATIGTKANIGAGTITCNYDGYHKYHTSIGAKAFIGSNSALIAPVSIGEGAIIGAGSAISEDVEAGSLAFTRSQQVEKKGWAKSFREKKKKAS